MNGKHHEEDNQEIINYNPKLMWSPDKTKKTNIDEFTQLINEKYQTKLENYHQLHKWSVDNYPEFWEEFFHFSKIIHSQPHEQVIDRRKRIDEIPQWFPGCQLNFAENLLRHQDGDKVALYATGEGGANVKSRTFDELRQRVAMFAAAMKSVGVKKGDRVAGYIPNCMEAVELLLATSSIGAVWSSTSPDFGPTGVLERFAQIRPKLLFSVDAVNYNGKRHSHLDKLKIVVDGLAELSHVVIIPFTGSQSNILSISQGIWVDSFLTLGLGPTGQIPKLEFTQVPFSHPLVIVYSSGTTGAPKCMVHSTGGVLIQHLKEHILQGNITHNDVIIYYTTTGWMMWNWLVTSIAVGATIVLYDGSPLVPTANVLWDLVDQLGITVFGTSAKWLAVLEDKGIKPMETHNLSSLHTILSTGSPLKPRSFDYVYEHIKKDVVLGSISGGTDILGCFMGQNHTLPVYKGEVQSLHLAIAIECWKGENKPVEGESGELVVTKPHPSMPVEFWNDPDGSKYQKAYFSNFKGVWCHGDFCQINPVTKGLVMLGRSDGTLNPNGVRFGSAEIYNIVEEFKIVQDSVCVAQRTKQGDEERVLLFLKMANGFKMSDELVEAIRGAIRSALSARHVPALILETKDIPYTINGKKVEVAVRDVIAGRSVANKGALANPQSLDLYKNLEELDNY
ncbi:hypothetical protein CHUAL_005930 [Chamberlinius hualienensis]